MDALTLSTGASLPSPGLGTWRTDAATLDAAIHHAVRAGYRHFDCAPIYGNEPVIGAALEAACAAAALPRAALFLASKLPPSAMHAGAARAALAATLAALRTDYLDLYMLHWPYAFVEAPSAFPVPPAERLGYDAARVLAVWRELERDVDAGRVRALGVSNFSPRKLRALLRAARHAPAVNQLELHPYLAQARALRWHAARGVAVTGYCPLGSPARPPAFTHADDPPALLGAPAVLAAAARAGATPAQVLLRWAAARGTCPLPKSVTPARLEENLAARGVALAAADVAALDALDAGHRFSRGEGFCVAGQDWRELWDEGDAADAADAAAGAAAEDAAAGAAGGFVARVDALADGTRVVTLAGGGYRALLAPALGAELGSLRFAGVELLHRGADFAPAPPAAAAWYGHAQVLFPSVGRCAGGAWTDAADGVARPMPLHGLAMRAPFELVALSAGAGGARAELELTSAALAAHDAAAAAAFPFDFSLRVTYEVSARGLAAAHAVRATGARAVPFAVGSHASFRVPLEPGAFPRGAAGAAAGWAAARLRGTPARELLLAPGSLLSGASRAAPAGFASAGGAALDAPGVLDGVFAGGFARGGRAALELADGAPRGLRVAVEAELVPPAGGGAACDWAAVDAARLFVLWGAPPAADGGGGFLCVEPWLGGPDALNGTACARVAPGEEATWTWRASAARDE